MSAEPEKNDAKTETLQDTPTSTLVDAVISELDKDIPPDVHNVERKLEGLVVGSITTEAEAVGPVGHDLNTAKEEKMPISSSNEDSATDTQLRSGDLKPDFTQDSQSEYLFRPPQTIFSSFRSTHRSRSYEQMVSRQPSRRRFENKDDVRDIHDRSYRNILDPRAGTPERFMTITAQALYGSNPPSLEEIRVSDYSLGLIRPLSLGGTPKQSSTADTPRPINDDEPVDGKPAPPTSRGFFGSKMPAAELTADSTSSTSVFGNTFIPSPATSENADLGTRSGIGEVWQRQCNLCPTVRNFHSADDRLAASDLCEGCETKRKTSC